MMGRSDEITASANKMKKLESEVAALREKLAAIEADTFTKCLAICEEERLADPRMKEEKAYEQAIDDCIQAIQQSKDSAQGEK